MIAWVEVWMQARWQRRASFSLVRAMWWKVRVDRRRARVWTDAPGVDRRRVQPQQWDEPKVPGVAP
jgi:hypothetical protein